MDQDLEKENGSQQLKKHNLMNMKVNMIKIKKMVLEFINGRMAHNMKAFSKMTLNKDKVQLDIKMGK